MQTKHATNGNNTLPELADPPCIPFGKLVILQPLEVKASKGGIVIPDSARRDQILTPQALVVAVGDEVKLCKRGDLVLFHPGRYADLDMPGLSVKLHYCHEDKLVGLLAAVGG